MTGSQTEGEDTAVECPPVYINRLLRGECQSPHPLTGGAARIRTPPQLGIPAKARRFGLIVRYIGGN
jgi:hypothetical protein